MIYWYIDRCLFLFPVFFSVRGYLALNFVMMTEEQKLYSFCGPLKLPKIESYQPFRALLLIAICGFGCPFRIVPKVRNDMCMYVFLKISYCDAKIATLVVQFACVYIFVCFLNYYFLTFILWGFHNASSKKLLTMEMHFLVQGIEF